MQVLGTFVTCIQTVEVMQITLINLAKVDILAKIGILAKVDITLMRCMAWQDGMCVHELLVL